MAAVQVVAFLGFHLSCHNERVTVPIQLV